MNEFKIDSDSIFLNRIKELKELKAGWLYGEGLPIEPMCFVLLMVYHEYSIVDGKSYNIYPTPEGGLSIEPINNYSLPFIEIYPNGEVQFDIIPSPVNENRPLHYLENKIYA